MKIINLPRGQGKTVRMLYASEFNDAPILCANNMQKKYLIDKSKELGLQIPEPITTSDVVLRKLKDDVIRDKNILVDEAPMILQSLLNSLGMKGEVKAITLTSDELKQDFKGV